MRVGKAIDVARELKISEARVYEIARNGMLPEACFFRIGRQVRFNLDEVERWHRGGGSPLAGDGRRSGVADGLQAIGDREPSAS